MKISWIIVISSIILYTIFILLIGINIYKTNSEINNISVSNNKTIYVSEQKDNCEAKGGKYYFGWSTFDDEYFERCKTLEQNIDLSL